MVFWKDSLKYIFYIYTLYSSLVLHYYCMCSRGLKVVLTPYRKINLFSWDSDDTELLFLKTFWIWNGLYCQKLRTVQWNKYKSVYILIYMVIYEYTWGLVSSNFTDFQQRVTGSS